MNGSELQEFIDRYNDAWNAHDVGAIVAMHTEDSVFENHVTGDLNVGREQIGSAIRAIFAVFPDLNFEGRRQYLRENLVVQEWTARGTHEGAMTRGGVVGERKAGGAVGRTFRRCRRGARWSRGPERRGFGTRQRLAQRRLAPDRLAAESDLCQALSRA